MAIADGKKAQTIINLLRDRVVLPIVQANAVAGKLQQAVIDNSLTGQFSAGELSALTAFVSNLTALASSPVVTAMETRYVLTHRSEALIIEDVNDGT